MHVSSSPPTIPGFDFAVLSESQHAQGGDYHDVFRSDAGIAIAVGDVAGHDEVAGQLKLTAAALLRRRTPLPDHLAALMRGMNRDLAAHLTAGRFMTMFLAVLRAAPRSIHWVSAGHGPVMVYNPETNGFYEIPGTDIPLGVDTAWTYHEQHHAGWATGSVMVVGTDGIWEARNPHGRMYGRKRLMATIRKVSGRNAEAIVQAVATDLAAFRRGRPLEDDLTLMVVKAV